MKNIFIVARKEALDTLRDKRTLIMMVILPVLVFPVIFTLMNRIQTSVMQKEQEKTLTVGMINLAKKDNSLALFLQQYPDMELIALQDEQNLEFLVRQDSIQFGIVIQPDFQLAYQENGTAKISLYFLGSKISGKGRIEAILREFEQNTIAQRIKGIGLPETFIKPLETQNVNVATQQEMIGKLAGGFLPYLFILFCFTGAMYPAIDLFTGEKERRTLETILTTPIKRVEILLGKMLIITLTGIISAVLAILGLFVAFQTSAGMPDFITTTIMGILSIPFILLMLLMLVPLTIFFAGVMVPLTIYAKTFKEAQSMLTPFTFLVIFPALIGMIPGIELSAITAIIPIVNITLATKEIIAGTMELPLLLLTVGSLISYAAISVVVCVKLFGKESNILR